MKTRALLVLPLIFLLSVEVVRADSATWNLNPVSGDWNTAANWTPATVPNGPGDTAFFGLSNATSVAYSGPTQLDGILFNPGASAFTITSASQELTISGLGITNNSGIGQNFVVFNTTGTIKFIGGAKAGIQTVFTNNYGSTQFFYYSTAESGTFVNYGSYAGGGTGFFDHSTAGNGNFFNNGGNLSGKIPGGVTFFRDNAGAGNGAFTNQAGSNMFFHSANYPGWTIFLDNSTAASGTFTNNGGAGTVGSGWNIGSGGGTYFDGASTAGNGTFTNNGGTGTFNRGGHTYFDGTSTAGNGIFTNNGGIDGAAGGGTVFTGDSSGGTARIILLGNGELDISGHNVPGMPIGSVEGDGTVFLGPNRLGIGSNNLNTIFSGSIKTGRNNERGGSLEKIGTGTLTLSGTNTYDRGTLISTGTLEIIQDGGLGTGDVIVTTSGATLRLQTGTANNYIADTAVFDIVSGSTVDLNFDGTPDTVLALVVDGVVQPAGLYGSAASGAPHQLPEFTGNGKILAATETTPTPTPTPTPRAHATNLSTRLLVGTGNDVGIGGFIVTGNGPRHLLLRGIGPSLSGIIGNALPDPSLQLRGPTGFQTLTNDNWRDTQEAEIIATGRAPGNDLESAILADLAPGAYTAILPGNGGTTGAGLFEIYDLSANQDSKLANISTRGNVGTGDDIMIAGVILGGASGEGAIIVRAIGPSLTGFPPGTVLPDPRLELRDRNGQLIIENDNWMDDASQAAMIQAAGLAPSNNFESAIAATLIPGEYTALLSGVNNGTGVGLVEVYDNPAPPVPTPTPCPLCTPTPPPPPTPSPTPTAMPCPLCSCIENFDGVTAPAFPSGWVASNPVPGDGERFVTSTVFPDSSPNDAFIPDQDGISDKVLDRVQVTVTSPTAMLSFRNSFNAEMSDGVFWDGGVLEVSTPNISNGDFLDVTNSQIGGMIVFGGYTGVISGDASNPLAGRLAWSGNSGGYIDTMVNLGPNLDGLTITLRWRFGSDEAVSAPGWRIDGLHIDGASCP